MTPSAPAPVGSPPQSPGIGRRRIGSPVPGQGKISANLLACIVIGALCFMAYGSALRSPFQMDDDYSIVNNDAVRNPLDVGAIFRFYGYRFFPFLTLSINYDIHGLNTFGYHAVNLVLHVLNSILLYALIGALTHGHASQSRIHIPAFTGALWFALHPIQTEAVTYIFNRSSLMATAFFISSVYLFIRGGTARYIGSVVCFVTGLWCKEEVLTLPCVLLLADVMFAARRPLSARTFTRHLPFFVGVGVYVMYRFIDLKSNFFGQPIFYVPLIRRLASEMPVIVHYLRMLILPFNQNVDHDTRLVTNIFSPPVLLSLVLLTVLSYIALRKASSPEAKFGLVWMGVTLVPFIMTPLWWLMAERWLYLPSIGFGIFLGTVFSSLLESYSNWQRTTVFAAACACIPLFLILDVQRNSLWNDPVTLWKDAVEKSPDRGNTHFQLGTSYQKKNLADKAIEEYRLGIALDPEHPEAPYIHMLLGKIYQDRGLAEPAIEEYRKGLALRPRHPEAHVAHNNLGVLLISKGLKEQARREFMMALDLYPDYLPAQQNLAQASGESSKK